MRRLQLRTLAAVVLIGATVVWRSPATAHTGEDTAPPALAGLERLFISPTGQLLAPDALVVVRTIGHATRNSNARCGR